MVQPLIGIMTLFFTEHQYFAGLVAGVIAPTIAALIVYLIREYNLKKDARQALKYEILTCAHELIDLKRVASTCKEKAKNKECPLLSIIYSELQFTAFNSLMSNALTGSIRGVEDEVYSLYAKFREHNLVHKRKINKIEALLNQYCLKPKEAMSPDERKTYDEYLCPNYAEFCDEIIRWSTSFEKEFVERFLKTIKFIDEPSWKSFKKTMGKPPSEIG